MPETEKQPEDKQIKKERPGNKEIALRELGNSIAGFASSSADYLQKTHGVDQQESFGVMREALDRAAGRAAEAGRSEEQRQALQQFEQECRRILLPVIEELVSNIDGTSFKAEMILATNKPYFKITIMRPEKKDVEFFVDPKERKILPTDVSLDADDLGIEMQQALFGHR